MQLITLPAHFDGEQIRLDAPFDLKPDTRLLVTILPGPESDEDYADWLTASLRSLEQAYGANEPDYSMEMVKEPNPDYEGR